MLEMKIEDTTLGELVTKVREAGFEEKYSLTVDDRIWRMYNKMEGPTLHAAYVSDCCDLIVTETFQKLSDETEERKAVEDIIHNYEASREKIDNYESTQLKFAGPFTLAGSIVGAVVSRHPLGVLIGGALGYAASELVRKGMAKTEEGRLTAYLADHDVYLGTNACERLTTKLHPPEGG